MVGAKTERNKRYDAKRRQSKPWRSFYNEARWCHPEHGRRIQQLRRQPLCQRCKEEGRIVQATVAHHKVKHNGDPILFWTGELASSCKPCHDRIEQGIEAKGYDTTIGADGWPVDPAHPALR